MSTLTWFPPRSLNYRLFLVLNAHPFTKEVEQAQIIVRIFRHLGVS
jgi:hypothetical protein